MWPESRTKEEEETVPSVKIWKKNAAWSQVEPHSDTWGQIFQFFRTWVSTWCQVRVIAEKHGIFLPLAQVIISYLAAVGELGGCSKTQQADLGVLRSWLNSVLFSFGASTYCSWSQKNMLCRVTFVAFSVGSAGMKLQVQILRFEGEKVGERGLDLRGVFMRTPQKQARQGSGHSRIYWKRWQGDYFCRRPSW